jgi:hypothetical protein
MCGQWGGRAPPPEPKGGRGDTRLPLFAGDYQQPPLSFYQYFLKK